VVTNRAHTRSAASRGAVDLSLNADSNAVYSVGGSVEIRAEGTWDVRGDRIHVFNKPGPVKLHLAAAPPRDPNVALRVVAQLPDGSPAEGLAVTWPNATGLLYISDGKSETGLGEGPVLGEVSIEREADSKGLATFVAKSGGPNSYRFTNQPSDVEPFDFQARALDAKADVLEVELGSSSATLQRVRELRTAAFNDRLPSVEIGKTFGNSAQTIDLTRHPWRSASSRV
jgi:hypothetical protein